MAKNPAKRIKGKVGNTLLTAGRFRAKQERIDHLKENYSVALITICKGAFDPRVVWDLPAGEPPDYIENPEGKKTIEDVQPGLGAFIKKHSRNNWRGNTPNIQAAARQRGWCDMLETMHKDEADVLIAMVDGTINKQFNITESVCKETWPKLFPPNKD
jgi:hypothetical protein